MEVFLEGFWKATASKVHIFLHNAAWDCVNFTCSIYLDQVGCALPLSLVQLPLPFLAEWLVLHFFTVNLNFFFLQLDKDRIMFLKFISYLGSCGCVWMPGDSENSMCHSSWGPLAVLCIATGIHEQCLYLLSVLMPLMLLLCDLCQALNCGESWSLWMMWGKAALLKWCRER